MTTINEEDIEKIAHLAQLELVNKQASMFIKHLNNVLEFIFPITCIDTQKIKPMYQVFDFALRLRSDQVTEVNQKELLQNNTSYIENDFYIIPKVIEICEIEN